jgi:hypothetical protein
MVEVTHKPDWFRLFFLLRYLDKSSKPGNPRKAYNENSPVVCEGSLKRDQELTSERLSGCSCEYAVTES